MLNPATITADGDTSLATVIRRHDAQSYAATFMVKGTLGGGTWTLQVSPDGGVTKYTVQDVSGNPISGTSTGYFNYVLAGDSGSNSGNMGLYVNMNGSTNPSMTVYNFDNR